MEPVLGRFVGRDPIGYSGGGLGLYVAYFVPNGLDPLGLRDLTADEVANLAKLEALAKEAESKGDTGYANNLRKSAQDIRNAVAKSVDPKSDPVSLKMTLWAIDIWSSQSRSGAARFTKSGSTPCPGYDSAKKGEYKCNYFVAYVWVLSTNQTPTGNKGFWFGARDLPPRAADWRNPSNPALSPADGKTQSAGNGSMGDVVNFPMEGIHDHCGVCIGNQLYVSARDTATMYGAKTPVGGKGPLNPADGVQLKDIPAGSAANYTAPPETP